MAAALNAFMQIGEAEGRVEAGSLRRGWIELQAWDWEVEAETSWTKGGGAAVGKPSPGKMNWEHVFDRSSNTILTYICTGKSLSESQAGDVQVDRHATGAEAFFTVKMNEAFITKVNQSGHRRRQRAAEGRDGLQDDRDRVLPAGHRSKNPGGLKQAGKFDWDIPAGVVSTPDNGRLGHSVRRRVAWRRRLRRRSAPGHGAIERMAARKSATSSTPAG